MSITNTFTKSFANELMQGVHVFSVPSGSSSSADTFKLALFTSSASLDDDTDKYESSLAGEVSQSGDYKTGGVDLTATTKIDGDSVLISFNDLSLKNATYTARGALVYNASKGNKSVMCLDFGSDKGGGGQTFEIAFPNLSHNKAMIRLSY